MEMKMSWVCLVLGLVLLMTISSDATNFLGHPDICCFSFVTFKIPDKEILEVVKTHSSCPRKGYVITTPRGRYCKKNLQ
ncbi:C-C motif chemokine 14-like [Pygocentrus nattereri]|uniref:C-C motif chemokine 14-like n=1 Tax=Pygocentrus nattereri TaxID=42514 RepID=UPI00081464ED|nr:C-C motif chemokine 14-like [Pygocentrus nattereri]